MLTSVRIHGRAEARSGVALAAIAAALALGAPHAAFAQAGPEAIDPNAPETGAPIDTEIGDTPQELADSATTGAEGSAPTGQIVVTGTLVRGIAPPGASPVTVSDEDIQATGATSVNDVLESVPQLGSFGTLTQPLANSQEVSTNKPNLRSLPGFNTSGGSTTLVLLDGHRVVGMGTASTVPDPDIIPPGVLQRVEIVPDGGSAIYGSDAVAGVLNFITIKRFDGVKVDAQYGFADDFYRYSGNITAGKDWGSGSIYASYNYAKNDLILGRDRDYIRFQPAQGTGVTSLACSPGTIQRLSGNAPQFTGLNPGGAPIAGVPNQCDSSDFATVFPAQRRHSVFAGLSQELSDSISLDIRAFYTNRKTRIQNGPYGFSELISNPGLGLGSSPFSTQFDDELGFLPGLAGSDRGPFDIQSVNGRFGADDAAQTRVVLDTWGVTPTITADLDGNWQLRVLGSYGQSFSSFLSDSQNQAALRSAMAVGLFNPYDPTTASAATIGAITDYQQFGRTKQAFHNLRAVVDGDLFTLPGGAIKLAAGLEYFKEEFDPQRGQTRPGFENTGFAAQTITGTAVLPGSATPQSLSFVVPGQAALRRAQLDRQVKSAFGELVIPIFGADNRTSGLYALNLSLSGRYDDYDDVGGTFNPRVGVTFKPVEWVSIFGAWGESFNAPSLADRPESDVNTTFILTGVRSAGTAPPTAQQLAGGGTLPNFPQGGVIVAQRGNAPGIKPQEAKTWNVGFDVRPPFVEGLSFGATYFNIEFDNLIGLPPFESPATLFRDFQSVITFTGVGTPAGGTNLAAVRALANAAVAGSDVIDGPVGSINSDNLYAFFDARRTNLGTFKLDGVDFRLAYERPFDFGSVFLNVNGTYELNRERSPREGLAFVDQLSDNVNRFRARSTLGTKVGKFLGQVTWNHLKGYDLVPAQGFTGTTLAGSPYGVQTFVAQTKVKDFNTFDLFFRYDLGDFGLSDELALTLNVENVFDKDPPVFRGGDNVEGRRGVASFANTLGRLVQFGISAKF